MVRRMGGGGGGEYGDTHLIRMNGLCFHPRGAWWTRASHAKNVSRGKNKSARCKWERTFTIVELYSGRGGGGVLNQ